MNLIKCEIATLRKWIANRDSRSLNSMAVQVPESLLNVPESFLLTIHGIIVSKNVWNRG